jgi:hypothetical protein
MAKVQSAVPTEILFLFTDFKGISTTDNLLSDSTRLSAAFIPSCKIYVSRIVVLET